MYSDFLAVLPLKIPFLQGWRRLIVDLDRSQTHDAKEHDHANLAKASTIWAAVNTILIADFVMSLDNVLAIAGLAKAISP